MRPQFLGLSMVFMEAFQNFDPFWLLCFPHAILNMVLEWLPLWILSALCRSDVLESKARSQLINRVSSTFEAWRLPTRDTLRMMRKTKTILSGSAALKIVDPSPWLPGDLDFYCPYSQYESVCQWFCDHGYTVSTSFDTTYQIETLRSDDFTFEDELDDVQYNFPRLVNHANACMKAVVRLAHPEHSRTINVIQSLSEHPAAPVCFFHSTLLMNIVTGTGVVCLYPNAVQQQKGIIGQWFYYKPSLTGLDCLPGLLNVQLNPPLAPVSANTLNALQKYQRRGYKFTHDVCREDEISLVIAQLRDREDTECAVQRHMQRSWTDGYSISMTFKKEQPLGLFPPMRWALSTRTYTDTGYFDLEPSVEIIQDDGRLVVYSNDVSVKRFDMAPEAL